ncbi:hypothetical protein U9M48_008301 [Paspalum notatum var. saurae]|uniref:CCHC-type domain-containing protein n=1 Tax=Paspalum notatum var. saurae TaxID=547442 RepID=A0AAQ3SPB5_PASNO
MATNGNGASSALGNGSASGFAASLKPQTPFDGANYKKWCTKMVLWLTAMNVYHVAQGKSEDLSSKTPEGKAFEAADNLFRGAVISALAETIVDSYMMLATGKEMWDMLEAKFGVSDPANFATSLKHKRQEFSVAELIGSLDVEEKARAKDTRAKGQERGSSANMVQKKSSQSQKKAKGKSEKINANQTTNFKKKKANKRGSCFVCGSTDHWAKECPDRKDKQQKKTANVVVANTDAGTFGSHGLLPS